MTVGEFCNRQVVIVRPNDKLSEAAQRMRDFHVGALIVVGDEDGRRIPVGVLTDRDLVVSVLTGGRGDLDTLSVGDVMTANPVTAREGDNLLDALKKMRSFGIRRLPIVNEQGGLEGIITFDDLVGVLAEELSDLSDLMAREQKRERAAVR
jgi:CBS domain-containing protein